MITISLWSLFVSQHWPNLWTFQDDVETRLVLAGYSGLDFAKVMESLYNVRATKCVNSMSRNSVYNDLFLTNHRKDRTKSQNKVAKSTMQTSAPAPKPEIPIESATSKVDTKSQVENAILSSLPQITNQKKLRYFGSSHEQRWLWGYDHLGENWW